MSKTEPSPEEPTLESTLRDLTNLSRTSRQESSDSKVDALFRKMARNPMPMAPDLDD